MMSVISTTLSYNKKQNKHFYQNIIMFVEVFFQDHSFIPSSVGEI